MKKLVLLFAILLLLSSMGTDSYSQKKPRKTKKQVTVNKDDWQPLPRCQAITKKKTQCKRNAKDGSNYCWQHSK